MAISPDSAKAIANLGVNMIVTAESRYSPDSIKAIVEIVRGKGSHITVHATGYSPDTLKAIAIIGGPHITIAI
ncbi:MULTISPECIES: hypothetical protein [unclassified Janthinobacterium]|uniref:hypothetical protein n=1 Tax=unclassified Janthinobacterium TaxID=2610881 RepID=UPI0011131E90|nr:MULTISPECIES: hypothetical protein [unclassified Janthinobacterium]